MPFTPEITIRARLNRRQAQTAITQLPDLIGGRGSAGGLVRVLYVRLGLIVQRFLHHAFMAKAAKATDAAGLRWKLLAPLTIALRKKGLRGKRLSAVDTILIETATLEKSLRPGVPPYAAAFAPPRVPEQVFRLQPGQVILGTVRKWALEQHEGRPQRQPPLPQRRLWPHPSSWPSLWWQLMLRQAQEGTRDILVYLLRR